MKAEHSSELPKPETDWESGTRSGDCLTSSDGSGFICSKCGETFPLNSDLLTHLCGTHKRIYSREKLDCGKKISLFPSFVAHKRIHTGEKPFTCTECGETFKNEHYLLRHQKIHIKQFACTECSENFTTERRLQIHQMIHMEKDKFTCTECGESFTGKGGFASNYYLHVHKRTHAGEKPFTCTE
ncbi:hypothetical protein XELAEV_18030432mg [Xenopus laevis]|uniref:C2H2-type domain-containing protein n=1 Tax=Xenopus laevis TaxID=8355 RepID=A0A974CKU2_XENLA|nr:hypothetical protein XELAEV_18030432mg [Xenopus laevis]